MPLVRPKGSQHPASVIARALAANRMIKMTAAQRHEVAVMGGQATAKVNAAKRLAREKRAAKRAEKARP